MLIKISVSVKNKHNVGLVIRLRNQIKYCVCSTWKILSMSKYISYLLIVPGVNAEHWVCFQSPNGTPSKHKNHTRYCLLYNLLYWTRLRKACTPNIYIMKKSMRKKIKSNFAFFYNLLDTWHIVGWQNQWRTGLVAQFIVHGDVCTGASLIAQRNSALNWKLWCTLIMCHLIPGKDLYRN